MYQVKIAVNGEEVRLTEFPIHIIANTLVGMLQSLQGVEDVDTAVIELNKVEEKK